MDDPLDEDMPGDSGPSADCVKAGMGPQDVLTWGDEEMMGYHHQIGIPISTTKLQFYGYSHFKHPNMGSISSGKSTACELKLFSPRQRQLQKQ